jgi:hypothetical protein
MRIDTRWIVPGLLLALLAGTAAAQQPDSPPPTPAKSPAAVEEPYDDDDDEEAAEPQVSETSARPFGRFYVEANLWMAQPTGTEYTPTVVNNPARPYDSYVPEVPYRTVSRLQGRFAWIISDDIGEIVGTYYSQTQRSDQMGSSPGNYIFGESQASPLFAGVWNDGLADAYDTATRTELRDVRIDFARKAMDAAHFRAKWFAGLRRVNFKWDASTSYHALVLPPDLFPPQIPPLDYRPDLDPLPDTAVSLSEYEGRGIEAGLDFEIPFGREKKFAFEGGFSVAALRGTLHTQYESSTSAYILTQTDGPAVYVEAPYDEFILPNPDTVEPDDLYVDSIQQVSFPVGVQVGSSSHASMIVETYFGFRWRPWKGLSVFAGMRDTRYQNAGEEVRPSTVTLSVAGVAAVQSVSRTSISPTYEGYYAGLGFLF